VAQGDNIVFLFPLSLEGSYGLAEANWGKVTEDGVIRVARKGPGKGKDSSVPGSHCLVDVTYAPDARSKVIISNLTVGGTYETNCRGGQATNGLQVPTNALTEGG